MIKTLAFCILSILTQHVQLTGIQAFINFLWGWGIYLHIIRHLVLKLVPTVANEINRCIQFVIKLFTEQTRKKKEKKFGKRITNLLKTQRY